MRHSISARILTTLFVAIVSLPATAATLNGVTDARFVNPKGDEKMHAEGVGSQKVILGKASEGERSSYLSFTGNPFVSSVGREFPLGMLTYFNGSNVIGTAVQSIDLEVTLRLGDDANYTATFSFGHEARPNSKDLTPEERSDFLRLKNASAESRLLIEGRHYTLRLRFGNTTHDGFKELDQFNVLEGKSATAQLLATFTPEIPKPVVKEVTPAVILDLKLPLGVKGMLLMEHYKNLPAGIVIESIFHRAVTDENRFWELWNQNVEGAQMLIGHWSRERDGTWSREYTFLAIPELYQFGRNRAETQYQESLAALSEQDRLPSVQIAERKDAYRNKILEIAAHSTDFTADQIAEQIVQTRTAFRDFTQSEEFAQARSAVLDAYSEHYPIAQKILLRTVTKTTEDREELVLDLAKATLSGGATVASTLNLRAIDASLEVLVEEGVLTEDEAKAMEAANTIVRTLNGASDADTVVKSIGLVGDSYRGLVDCGVIDEEKMDDQVKARIQADEKVIDLLIMLGE
jgi:hypothetical protein